MHVVSARGGKVHADPHDNGSPACNPWQPARKFRATSDPITCATCIRRDYDHDEEPAMPATIDARDMSVSQFADLVVEALDASGRIVATEVMGNDDQIWVDVAHGPSFTITLTREP